MKRLICDMDAFTDILSRLTAYEDTGLEPGEVREPAKAKKDGRLVVFPWPVTVVQSSQDDEIDHRHVTRVPADFLAREEPGQALEAQKGEGNE